MKGLDYIVTRHNQGQIKKLQGPGQIRVQNTKLMKSENN